MDFLQKKTCQINKTRLPKTRKVFHGKKFLIFDIINILKNIYLVFNDRTEWKIENKTKNSGKF